MGYANICFMKSGTAFTNWLQDELNKRGLIQADLSRMTGMTTAGISNMFTRQKVPKPENLQAIARAFKYTPEFVFRVAGLLPKETPTDEELEFLFSQLLPDDQEEVKEFIRMKLNRRGGTNARCD
jgi:transcriptional regulator with XRE-family HTH domain